MTSVAVGRAAGGGGEVVVVGEGGGVPAGSDTHPRVSLLRQEIERLTS